MSYVCPHCQKSLKTKGSLGSHIAKLHSDKSSAPVPDQENQAAPTETLEIEAPPEPTSGYHCIDCGAALDKGQTPCPGCGGEPNWSLVE